MTIKVGALEEGTYFIGNKQTGKYMDLEGAGTADGTPIQQWEFHGQSWSRWVIKMQRSGAYSIQSAYTGKYIGVENSSTVDGAAIKQYASVDDQPGREWYISQTSGGAYRFRPGSSSGMALAVPASGASTDGTDLVQLAYTNDTNYRDEWVVERLLPTSGYEVDYSYSLWDEYVSNCCNCYAYAINNQVYPGTNFLWFMQQMGEYQGNMYTSFSGENIYNAVVSDYQRYNSIYDQSLVFEPIGRYDVCPAGTYKVALVISNNDYHWYRQDSDGLWSHKPGITPVTRLDASNKYIVDPFTADWGNYTEFVGYFAVSPWGNMYEISDPIYCYIQGYVVLYDNLMELLDSYYVGCPIITNTILLSMMCTYYASMEVNSQCTE